ncbi:MAG: caspase family protein, partial [Nitrospirae bacterium]|nr:caspase family protein [Nitrospirota bacterium]
IAVNKYESSVPATVALGWKEKVKKDEEFLKKPKLYVLAIGISNYKDEDNKLMYSSKDAKDFAGVMEKQKGLLYRDVEVKVITDEIATRMNVLDGFDWILNNVTNKDIAMVLLSGHGYNDPDGAYYYIPVDVDLKRIKSTAVIFTEIKNTVFIDTCHAGNVMGKRKGLDDLSEIIKELVRAENGAIVFTSSTGRQDS